MSPEPRYCVSNIDMDKLDTGRFEVFDIDSHHIKGVLGTLNASFAENFLTVTQWNIYERQQSGRIKFSIHGANFGEDLIFHTSEILDIVDYKWSDGTIERLIVIPAILCIERKLISTTIFITKRPLWSTPLSIGGETIKQHFEVDKDRAFIVTKPEDIIHATRQQMIH